MSVCPLLLAIKFDTVTASVMRMHHMLIFTLTFIQGHTDPNHINKIVQAMPIKFAVRVVRLTVNLIFIKREKLTWILLKKNKKIEQIQLSKHSYGLTIVFVFIQFFSHSSSRLRHNMFFVSIDRITLRFRDFFSFVSLFYLFFGFFQSKIQVSFSRLIKKMFHLMPLYGVSFYYNAFFSLSV